MGAGDFERWWPEVAPRLTHALARRGVTAADAEDIVQETALRALAAAASVASAEELRRWSFTVARRIEIDRARRRSRAEVVGLDGARLPAAAADVARAAEHRIAWATAVEGLAGLSAGDRSALLSVVDGDGEAEAAVDRKTAVREAVRRHRARARLVAAVGKLVGVGIVAREAVRRTASKLQPRHAEVGFVMAVGVLLLPTGTPPSTAEPVASPPPAAPAPAPVEERAPHERPEPPARPAERVAERSPAPPAPPTASPAPDNPPGAPRSSGRTLPVPAPCHCEGVLPSLEIDGRSVYLNEVAWCAGTADVPCTKRALGR